MYVCIYIYALSLVCILFILFYFDDKNYRARAYGLVLIIIGELYATVNIIQCSKITEEEMGDFFFAIRYCTVSVMHFYYTFN